MTVKLARTRGIAVPDTWQWNLNSQKKRRKMIGSTRDSVSAVCSRLCSDVQGKEEQWGSWKNKCTKRLKSERYIYRGKAPKQLLHYQPLGRCDPGRPRRRWFDVSGRNELTSSTITEDDKLVLHLQKLSCVRLHSNGLDWVNVAVAHMISFHIRSVGGHVTDLKKMLPCPIYWITQRWECQSSYIRVLLNASCLTRSANIQKWLVLRWRYRLAFKRFSVWILTGTQTILTGLSCVSSLSISRSLHSKLHCTDQGWKNILVKGPDLRFSRVTLHKQSWTQSMEWMFTAA
jgi:hypothetical protein